MKTFQTLFMALMVFTIHAACNSPENKNGSATNTNQEVQQVSNNKTPELIYFHFTRRCVTCNAIETVSKETIADLYGNKAKFTSYNLDEEAGKTKGTELEVTGQTLLIVAGDTKIDLTNEAFMNARSNPEKLKQVIKEKIDTLLN